MDGRSRGRGPERGEEPHGPGRVPEADRRVAARSLVSIGGSRFGSCRSDTRGGSKFPATSTSTAVPQGRRPAHRTNAIESPTNAPRPRPSQASTDPCSRGMSAASRRESPQYPRHRKGTREIQPTGGNPRVPRGIKRSVPATEGSRGVRLVARSRLEPSGNDILVTPRVLRGAKSLRVLPPELCVPWRRPEGPARGRGPVHEEPDVVMELPREPLRLGQVHFCPGLLEFHPPDLEDFLRDASSRHAGV